MLWLFVSVSCFVALVVFRAIEPKLMPVDGLSTTCAVPVPLSATVNGLLLVLRRQRQRPGLRSGRGGSEGNKHGAVAAARQCR